MDMTVGCGRRSSAAQAYLRPSLKRKSLKIFSNTLVTRILIEGKRAVGVEIFKNGTTRKIFAAKEVILCAGAISTPNFDAIWYWPNRSSSRHRYQYKTRFARGRAKSTRSFGNLSSDRMFKANIFI